MKILYLQDFARLRTTLGSQRRQRMFTPPCGGDEPCDNIAISLKTPMPRIKTCKRLFSPVTIEIPWCGITAKA
jgi:hypothetical protein